MSALRKVFGRSFLFVPETAQGGGEGDGLSSPSDAYTHAFQEWLHHPAKL